MSATRTAAALERPAHFGELPTAAVAALVAAMTLEIGSSLDGDLLVLAAIPLTLIGFGFAVRSLWMSSSPARQRWLPQVTGCLSAIGAVALIAPSMHAGSAYETARRIYALAGIVIVGTLDGDDRLRRRVIGFMIGAALVLQIATPLAIPHPLIDVVPVTDASVRALLGGVHPYTIRPPDPTGGAFNVGYRLTVYPYMPLTLLAYAPVVAAAGDFRFLLAGSFVLTVLVLRAIGRRIGADPKLVDATTLALVLHPASTALTANGWTENLMACVLAIFVYVSIRAPQTLKPAAVFFLLPALKQYIVAPTLMYVAMTPTRPRIKAATAGMGMALLTLVPFFAWEWRATAAGIFFQMLHLDWPRLDSDSVVALAGLLTGRYPGIWLSAVVQLVVGAVAYFRVRRLGLAGFLTASALSLYAGFLVGWQAFVNYYYFVSVMLLLAALLWSRHPLQAA